MKLKFDSATFIGVLFIVSLLLRLSFTFITYYTEGMDNWVDSKVYLRHGTDFANGNLYPLFSDKYPYMCYGPVIPLLVASAIVLFGDPIWPVLVLNCLISSLLVLILYKLGKMVVNTGVGMILSIWAAFNFNFIFWNGQILKEPYLITILPLITLLSLFIYHNKRVVVSVIFSSLLFSVLVHTDERFLIFAPLIILAILLSRKTRKRIAISLLWMGILVLSMVPWTVRNYKQFGDIVILTPRTTSVTSKLWGLDILNLDFSSDDNLQRYIDRHMESAIQLGNLHGKTPRLYGHYERYIRAFYHLWKPTYFNLTYIHTGYEPTLWSLKHNLTSIVFYGIFLPFYIGGVLLAAKRKNGMIVFIGLIPIIYSIFHAALLIWPLDRYRLPMDFCIAVVALWCCYNMRFKQSSGSLRNGIEPGNIQCCKVKQMLQIPILSSTPT